MQKNLLTLRPLRTILLLVTLYSSLVATQASAKTEMSQAPSLESFHARALAHEPLNVVFFGGSLTWGANASDPQITSYRGLMTRWLQQQYPNTPIHFHDAAIGGTGSKLGLFRLERDVLAHQPDLVFLDFTVNDDASGTDHESLACYETLMRSILESGSALMPVTMMFKWHVEHEKDGNEFPARHRDHIKLAESYNVPLANTIPHVRDTVAAGTQVEMLWPFDGAHPDDTGYELFFEAVRDRYLAAIADSKLIPTIPETPVYGDRYSQRLRHRLKDHPLPDGWAMKKTYRTSLWYDGLASRWMTDVATASKKENSGALSYKFEGKLVGFFGERNGFAPDVKIWIDGKLVLPPKVKDGQTAWHLATDRFAPPKKGSGNLFMWTLIADDLEDGPHTLKIEPIWDAADESSELRIESICTAGPTK